MDAILSEAEVSENIEKCIGIIRKIGLRWSRGMMTDREALDAADDSLRKGFVLFLEDKGLRFRFDSRKYSAFLEDHKHFESCGEPLEDIGTPWLMSPGPSGRGQREAAAPADRAAFFRLMKAFHIPPHYFLPPPDDTPSPLSVSTWFPGDRLRVWELWTNGTVADGGFSPGEHVILVNSYGQKADLLITKGAFRDRFTGSDTYSGIGVIEGYTSQREREISITALNGQVGCLTTVIERDDLDAFNSYPLWQPFFIHQAQAWEVWESILWDLLRTFSKEGPGQKN